MSETVSTPSRFYRRAAAKFEATLLGGAESPRNGSKRRNSQFAKLADVVSVGTRREHDQKMRVIDKERNRSPTLEG